MQEITRRTMDMKRFKKIRAIVIEKITKLVDKTDDQSKNDLAVLREALNTGNFTKAYEAGLIDMTLPGRLKPSQNQVKRKPVERYDAKEMSDEEIVQKIKSLMSKGYSKTKIAVCFNKSDAWVYLKLKKHDEKLQEEKKEEPSAKAEKESETSQEAAEDTKTDSVERSEVVKQPEEKPEQSIVIDSGSEHDHIDRALDPIPETNDHDEGLKQIEYLQSQMNFFQKEADHWMNMYKSQSETTRLIAAQRDDYKEIAMSKQKKLADSNGGYIEMVAERDEWKKRAFQHERNYYQANDHIERLEEKLNAALTTLKLMVFKQETERLNETEKRLQP